MQLRFHPLKNFTQPTDVPRWLFNWEDGTFERDEQHRRQSRNDDEEIWFDALEDLPDRETRSLAGG